MSETFIPKALREEVAAEARSRCGYCLAAEAIVGMPMELDHLVPESLGGLTVAANLWLACSLCNNHKAKSPRPTPNRARRPGCSTRAARCGLTIFDGAMTA